MWSELPPTAGLPLKLSDLVSGRAARGLERVLADFLKVADVQLECSGTACMVLALQYLKEISPRRQVVIPGYTCPLVPIAVAQAGLQPILCDTAYGSASLSENALARALNDNTLAVIVTHMAGLPAPMRRIMDMAAQAGAYVIEDAAQALGALDGGRSVGTTGDIGVFSLSLGKGLTMYQGGFMVARDYALRSGLRQFAERTVVNRPLLELQRIAQLIAYAALYNPVTLPLVYGQPLREWLRQGQPEMAVGDVFPLETELCRVGNYRRAVCAAAAKRLPDFLSENRRRGRQRAARLAELAGIDVWHETAGTAGSWPFLMAVFEDPQHCQRALNTLWTSGLGVTRLFVNALNGYDYLSPVLPQYAHLPNARALARSHISITNSHWLSDRQFEHILAVIERARDSKAQAQRILAEATL